MTITSETERRITGMLDDATRALEGQSVLSAARTVDVLLDLYGATVEPGVRAVCADALRRLGRVNLVRAEDVRAELHAVAAAVAGATIAPADPVTVAVPHGGELVEPLLR